MSPLDMERRDMLSETNLSLLQARSKDCPHIYRVIQEMRHGVPPENAIVGALLGLSGAVEAQGKMLTAIMMNQPSAPIRVGELP